MSFINLTLINSGGYFGVERCGNATIHTESICYIEEKEDCFLLRVKNEYLHISKQEYEEKVKFLFKSGTVNIALGTIFIKDIEAFWNIYDKYYLHMSWKNSNIEINKEDYDKIVEVIHLKNNNVLELLINGELFNFNHYNIREYLYWKDRNGSKTYIKYFSDEYLVNLINFIQHIVVKRDCDEKWIKVLNNEIEFRKSL